MKKISLILLIASTVSILSCTEEPKSKEEELGTLYHAKIYVVNSSGNSISIIDLTADAVYNDVYTTGITPAEIKFRDGKIYLVNSGDNTLQIIDTFSGDIDFIEIGDYRNPAFLEFVSDNIIAVCNFSSGTVSFVALSTHAVETEIPVGAGLWGMELFNQKIYVGISNFDMQNYTYGQGRVAVIDAVSHTLQDSITVGTNPGILFLDPQGELNVVCTGDYATIFSSIWRIYPDSNWIINSSDFGGTPISEAMTTGGVVYFAGGGDWSSQGYVMCYNTMTESAVRSGYNPIILSGKPDIEGIVLDNNDNIYVASFNTDEVLLIDIEGNILKTYNLGDGPQKMVFVDI